MPRMPVRVLSSLLSSLAVLGAVRPAAAQAPIAPTLTFGDQTVQAQGMTPGGTVVWFGMGLDIVEYSEVRTERQEPAVADAQGNASLVFPAAVPARSVWVAVDLATGAYAMGSPAGFAPSLFTLAPGAIFSGSGAAPDQLADSADFLHVLLVRPGQGAWAGTFGRGGTNDQSSPGDPNLRFALASLDPITPNAAAAPAHLALKDLLFLARPRTMEMGTLAVH